MRVNLTAALAVIALVIAVAEFIVPLGPRVVRLSPGYLIVIALLLAARYLAKKKTKTREEILKSVPRRPLGISDEDESSPR